MAKQSTTYHTTTKSVVLPDILSSLAIEEEHIMEGIVVLRTWQGGTDFSQIDLKLIQLRRIE